MGRDVSTRPGIHQLQTTLITGAGPTVIAAAKAGYRVKIYAYALAGAANIIARTSDNADLTGVLPAGSLAISQPDFLIQGPNDNGLQVEGGGTGFVVWAYEKYVVVNQ